MIIYIDNLLSNNFLINHLLINDLLADDLLSNDLSSNNLLSDIIDINYYIKAEKGKSRHFEYFTESGMWCNPINAKC